MRFALSTDALPHPAHTAWFGALAQLGLAGLEIAPGRTWPGILPSQPEIAHYRREVESAGLTVVGLHGLLDQRTELDILGNRESRRRCAAWISDLSALCRDLGGRTLILGGERWRRGLPERQAWERILDAIEPALSHLEDHGTVLCVEPIPPVRGDFCTRANECRLLVNYVSHASLGLQLGSAALVAANDLGHAPFAAVRGRLELFHAGDPAGAPFDTTGQVDHADFRRHLAAIGHRDWVCLDQRTPGTSFEALAERIANFKTLYSRRDNQSLERLRLANAA